MKSLKALLVMMVAVIITGCAIPLDETVYNILKTQHFEVGTVEISPSPNGQEINIDYIIITPAK